VFVKMTTTAPTTAPAAAPAANPAPAAAAAATPATPSSVVFVGKIPTSCEKPAISQFLSAAGTVKRITVKKPRRIENGLYAFADFETAESAAKAIETLNGKELAGAAVVVEAARNPFPKKRKMQRKRKPSAAGAANATPAAAGTTPAAGTTATPTEKKQNRRRRRHPFNHRRRRPYVDAPISKDVAYVVNLPYIVDEEHMKEIFEGCKFIEARVVRRAYDQRSKGFGFVTFASEADRAEAIKLADGSVVEGRKIHVSPARQRVERPKTKTEETPAPAAAAAAPAATSN